jgi:hypothetical protein
LHWSITVTGPADVVVTGAAQPPPPGMIPAAPWHTVTVTVEGAVAVPLALT